MGWRLTFAFTLHLFTKIATGQGCQDVARMARIARVNSVQTLTAAAPANDASYAIRLVYAFRVFQLQPMSKGSAEHLLSYIPTTGEQWLILGRLGDSLCDDETMADIRTLSKVRDGIPRELATAVLKSPRFLPQYVRYSMDDTLDPHSDSAIQMRRVCQKVHSDFIRALESLPPDKQSFFGNRVMNPKSCSVLTQPEK